MTSNHPHRRRGARLRAVRLGLAVGLCASSRVATAEGPAAPDSRPVRAPFLSEIHVQASLGAVAYFPLRPIYAALSLSVAARTPASLEVEVGGHFLLSRRRPGAEGHLAAFLAPRLGRWHPRAGAGIGLSGAARPSARAEPLDDLLARRYRASPLYVTFAFSAVRFQVGRATLSGLDLGVGTDLLAPGRAVRVEVSLVTFAWRLR